VVYDDALERHNLTIAGEQGPQGPQGNQGNQAHPINTLQYEGSRNIDTSDGYNELTWEYTYRKSIWLPYSSAQTFTINESDYGGNGSVYGGVTWYHIMKIELDVMGMDNSSQVYRRFYRGFMYKGPYVSDPDYWTPTTMTKIDAEDFGTMNTGSLTVAFTLSGTHHENLNFALTYNGASNPTSTAMVRVHIVGGGRKN
jgi:hypothetical protein